MKKIKLYLESSALWILYYEEIGAELVEYCLENPRIDCITSVWSRLEIERGIKKRENQKEILPEEAENLRIFIEADSKRIISKKQLIAIPIEEKYILTARRFITEYNLYASDALHLASGILQDCIGLIVDDYHFKRLDKIIESREGITIYPAEMSVSALIEELNLL